MIIFMNAEQHFKEAKRLLGFLRDLEVKYDKDVASGDILIDKIIQHFLEMQDMNCEEAHKLGLMEGKDSAL